MTDIDDITAARLRRRFRESQASADPPAFSEAIEECAAAELCAEAAFDYAARTVSAGWSRGLDTAKSIFGDAMFDEEDLMAMSAALVRNLVEKRKDEITERIEEEEDEPT